MKLLLIAASLALAAVSGTSKNRRHFLLKNRQRFILKKTRRQFLLEQRFSFHLRAKAQAVFDLFSNVDSPFQLRLI